MRRTDTERVCLLHDTKAILDQFSRDVIARISYSPDLVTLV